MIFIRVFLITVVLQAVTCSAYRLYCNFRIERSEFFSYKGNVNFYIVVFHVAVKSPDLFYYLFLWLYYGRIAHQHFKYLKFLASESGTSLACGYLVRIAVQHEIAVCQTVSDVFAFASCDCLYTGKQLVTVKRFGHVIVCADVEPADNIGHFAFGRKHYYRSSHAFVAQFFEHSHSVHDR